ncbi:MAG: peptidylprolyl isomerase [Owenweeksia sp.]|nr:peptidylprolyl isomerase [Owenweeksia sp.]
MGMDTMSAFRQEYNSYRNQLAKPYLNDKDVTEELVEEAYERMKYDVQASHIMIKVPENAPPSDTVEAYKRIVNIKEKIENGAFFDQMAKEYSEDDYSAKRGGDLGYFTVFNMVYPFENAVYNTDIGKMTGPIRTRYGYHLIKPLTSARPVVKLLWPISCLLPMTKLNRARPL